MKTLIIITLAALLTACGCGSVETVTLSDTVTTQPAIIVTQPEPLVEPKPVCDLTTYNPCGGTPIPPPVVVGCVPGTNGCNAPEGMELCDIWSYNPCAHPTWIAKQPR